MKFCKNKAKVILYYCAVYILLAVLVATIVAMVFDENTIQRIAIIELILVAAVSPFIKMHIAEVKQTIELGEKEIICENFIISGNVANGKIDYKLIESITLKSVLLKPFSYCLFIKLKNEKPFVLNDDFINHKELWLTFCQKCKENNPDAFIDEAIFKKIGK